MSTLCSTETAAGSRPVTVNRHSTVDKWVVSSRAVTFLLSSSTTAQNQARVRRREYLLLVSVSFRMYLCECGFCDQSRASSLDDHGVCACFSLYLYRYRLIGFCIQGPFLFAITEFPTWYGKRTPVQNCFDLHYSNKVT